MGCLMWFYPDYATGRAMLETVQFLAAKSGAIVALMPVYDEMK